MVATIYDGDKELNIVDLNSEHPFLTMESHVHSLHVIINTHLTMTGTHPLQLLQLLMASMKSGIGALIWSCCPPSLKKDNGIWSDYGRLALSHRHNNTCLMVSRIESIFLACDHLRRLERGVAAENEVIGMVMVNQVESQGLPNVNRGVGTC